MGAVHVENRSPETPVQEAWVFATLFAREAQRIGHLADAHRWRIVARYFTLLDMLGAVEAVPYPRRRGSQLELPL